MSQNAIKVSYVITVCNKGHSLPPVLDALAAQTGDFSREFVFVDDASTDHGPDLIRASAASWDHPVRMIRQPNGGPASATNTGLKAASGEYIKLVDADDILSPWATSTLIALAERSGCDAIYGIGKYYAKGEVVAFPDSPESPSLAIPSDPLTYAICSGLAGASHLLVRREAALAVGGCDEGVFAQDHSLALRLARRHRIGLSDALIWQGPQDDPARLMKNTAQHLHDYNYALARFIHQHDLAPRYSSAAAKRASGRAWNFAKRHLGFRRALPWLALKLQAERDQIDGVLFDKSCLPFRLACDVRIPARYTKPLSVPLPEVYEVAPNPR